MLYNLTPAKGAVRARKRVARGNSAGGGTTAGRGTKGQQARAGSGGKHQFQGGQTPLMRRQPKLGGFRNPGKICFEIINLSDLGRLEAGEYGIESLRENNVVRTRRPVKLLGKGEIKKKLVLSVNAASKSAIEAVERAGGKLKILARAGTDGEN